MEQFLDTLLQVSQTFSETFGTFSKVFANNTKLLQQKKKQLYGDRDVKGKMNEEMQEENRVLNQNNGKSMNSIHKQKENLEENEKKSSSKCEKKKIIRKRRRRSKKLRNETDQRPKPPVNQFMLYLKDHQQIIRNENPEAKPSQVPILASKRWKSESVEVVNKYKDLYRKKQQDYKRDMKNFIQNLQKKSDNVEQIPENSNDVVQISDSSEKQEEEEEEYKFQL